MVKLFVAAVLAGVLIVPATALAESNKSNSKSEDSSKSKSQSKVWRDADNNDDEDDDDSDDKTKKSSKTSSTTTAATASPTTGPTTKKTNAQLPGDVLDLSNWYLTLPTGAQGKPDTIKQADLAGYSSQFMRLNQSADGVVFTANAGGTTTKNSKYPRSELREMTGDKNASWDGNKGTHTMVIRQSVNKIPEKKAEVVVGQIHATSDDLMQIHLAGNKMTVKYNDGKDKVALDDNYQLGKVFTVAIESADGHVKVWYDGELKADLPISSETSYFKAGNYLQTNTSKGDGASTTSEVVIYALDVKHTN